MVLSSSFTQSSGEWKEMLHMWKDVHDFFPEQFAFRQIDLIIFRKLCRDR